MSSPRVLDGKVAVVTGATRGIGSMVTEGLLQAGASVYVGSRSSEAADATVERFRSLGDCRALPGSLSGDEACRRLADTVASDQGHIHILVNNAAVYGAEPMEEMTEELWDDVFDTNVKTPFLLTRAFLPLLSAAASADDPARIINMGSISGLLVDGLPSYPYSASKAALHHLTRILASELAPKITVNAIAPGPFDSDTLRVSFARWGDRGKSLPSPMRRMGRSAEIGGTTVFLASAAGAYITGAVLPVDGGIATTR